MLRVLMFALLSVLPARVGAQSPLVFGEGEAAPPLRIGAWVRGEPVARFERGKVYVVQFWASWCAASQRAIPRLTALQRAHPDDLVVIAVSSPDSHGESLDRVTELVSRGAQEIGYRVAFDDRRRTAREWLDAFDVRNIPTAFLIDREGEIAWIGNPLWPPGELAEATRRVLAGPFTHADRHALRLANLEKRDRIARAEREFEDIGLDQPARALRLLDVLLELNPDGAAIYAARRFDVLLATPDLLDEAFRFGRRAAEGVLRDDAERLKSMAWSILEAPGLARRDLDLALVAVERAAEITRRRDADVLDTLARTHFRRAEFSKAVETQKRAVELTTEEFLKEEFTERLREYESAAVAPH